MHVLPIGTWRSFCLIKAVPAGRKTGTEPAEFTLRQLPSLDHMLRFTDHMEVDMDPYKSKDPVKPGLLPP